MLPWPASTLSLSLLLIATLFMGFQPVAALTYSPLAEPLAVKTPFLNTWNHGGSAIPGNWPFNGGDNQITGWAGLARVDGVGYIFLGDGSGPTGLIGTPGVRQSISITATQTIYTIKCGGVDLTVTFLSPIEPSDFVKLSLPFSYMSVTTSPNDGKQHSVQIYSDLSGEWLSDSATSKMTWSTQKTGTMVYHQFALVDPVQYSVQNGRAQYGTGYHGILTGERVTYQSGADVGMRTGFNLTGHLNNTIDTGFRAINDQWPCFGLSKDLGTISTTSGPVIFALGLSRDPAISYQVSSGPQARSLYYKTKFDKDEDALSFFLNDYATALASANNFDSKLNQAASQISENYADLVALAARQIFSSVELTVSTGSDGKPNSSDPLLFIGPDGVNRIETIYATAPFWAYVNPALLRLLIQPALQWHRRNQLTYVIDDIGESYPQATGPSSLALNSPKSLEATGDMMIVTAALIRASGDTSVVSSNADLYRSWAEYLKANALYPGNQKTTDGGITTTMANPINDTNLAVKGIVALKAYADILTSLGQDGSTYSSAATSYAATWQNLAATSSGYSSSYGDSSSWSMVYNLFADKWLRTSLFPDAVFQKLSSQYAAHTNMFGVPLNSDTTITTAQWMIFAAGLVPDTETRDSLVAKAQSYIQNGGPDKLPWASSFEAIAGNSTQNTYGRPSIGGVYALLVRDQAGVTQSPVTPSPSNAFLTLSGVPPIYQLTTTVVFLLALL